MRSEEFPHISKIDDDVKYLRKIKDFIRRTQTLKSPDALSSQATVCSSNKRHTTSNYHLPVTRDHNTAQILQSINLYHHFYWCCKLIMSTMGRLWVYKRGRYARPIAAMAGDVVRRLRLYAAPAQTQRQHGASRTEEARAAPSIPRPIRYLSLQIYNTDLVCGKGPQKIDPCQIFHQLFITLRVRVSISRKHGNVRILCVPVVYT